MSPPKGFLPGVILGTVLACPAYFLAVWFGTGAASPATQEAGALIQFKRQAAAGISKPKVLLVGGSSVDNGISARQIEEATGLPAANLGLWVPLGPAYILEQARRVARPGDLVVLALEYNLYDWGGSCPYWVDTQFIPLVFACDPQFVAARTWPEWLHLAIRMPNGHLWQSAKNRLRPARARGDAAITAENHNLWGDSTNNVPANRPKHVSPLNGPQACNEYLSRGLSSQPKAFPFITAFCEWARTNDVRVVATFPNLAQNSAYQSVPAHRTETQIKDFFASQGVPVLGTVQDALFPPEECFDTHYHLMQDAVRRRTKWLLAELRPFLPVPASQADHSPTSQ